MSDSQNGHRIDPLPAELELALAKAASGALSALHSLRKAVRDHVHDECSRGTSQSEIDDGLRSLIDSCAPDLGHVDYSAERADEVRTQVLVWSASFYTPRT
jgi:hypothetical protein